MSHTGKSRRGRGRTSGASRRRLLIAGAGLVAGGGVVASLWPSESVRTSHAYTLAPESVLDARIRRAPPEIREAYRFAVANRELLNKFPCFCGCFEQDGHRGNADCYVEDIRPDGSVVFDYMSLG
ncbi:MAG TPA: PCYCGC motif-containing (lipo)protein [Thermodesulfobacteriota bacterium]